MIDLLVCQSGSIVGPVRADRRRDCVSARWRRGVVMSPEGVKLRRADLLEAIETHTALARLSPPPTPDARTTTACPRRRPLRRRTWRVRR